MSLGSWLATARACVAAAAAPQAGEPSAPPVTLVIGNEASDADSIVAALTYAYFRAREGGDEHAGRTIPMVACDRADMSLRRETVHLLGLCGVEHGGLVFLDDAGTGEILARAERVVLVDHNQAVGPVASLGDRVAEIVDHHKDSEAHGHVVGDLRKVAFQGGKATAGSCCTLVAEAYLASDAGRELLARDDGAVARALLGVILVDTVNLDPKAQKATDRDTHAVEVLERLAPQPPCAELFKQLDGAKFDAAFWDSLALDQCLRYDYKQFEARGKVFGLSSVLCSLESLASKAGWCVEVGKWAGKVDLYGVLTNVKSAGGGAPHRQIALVSGDAGACAAEAADFAAAYKEPPLQLEPMELQGPPGLKAFRQLNVAASRKQVAPCLSAFLHARV